MDLKVTADVVGFSEVLVIKSAEAAKNPQLKKITFKSHSKNSQVRLAPGKGRASRDAPGLEVVDAKGALVFTGDATRMWDSSGDATASEHLGGLGEGRRTAAMGMELTAQGLTIVPDQAFLIDENTKFPVYLDPDYSCGSCGKTHHVVVQSGYPDAKNFDANSGSLSDLKAGYQTTDSSGISRTYMQMNTGPVIGKTIHWATLNTTLNYSWWGSGSAKPTELWLANWIDGNTTWRNQLWIASVPGVDAFQGSSNVTNQSKAPDVSMQFTATGAVRAAASGSWSTTTFLLKGEQEGNTTSWRRFGLNPYLEVHYNSTPNNPWSHSMQNGAVPCVKGDNRPWLATRTPTVQAWVSDPDGGSLGVHVATTGGPYGADVPGTWHENINNLPWVGTPGPNQGALAQVAIPADWITSDGIHKWAMRVTDGGLTSPRWDWDCEFFADTSKPLSPKLTATNTPVNQADQALFDVTVDMTTAGLYNIDRFVYTTDGSEPSTQGSSSVSATKVVDGAGKITATAKITTTAINANQNLVKIRAVNKAGTPGPNGTCVSPLVAVGSSCAYTVLPLTSAKFLKGAWALDHQGGTTATDYVATLSPGETAHDALLNGGATWTEGYSRGNGWTQSEAFGTKDGVRGGLSFNGTGHAQTASSVVNTSNSFSVSAWARLTANNSYYTVASQDGAQVSGFFLQYSADVGKWTFSTTNSDAITGAPNRATSSDTTAAAPLNVWTHLVGTYDAPSRTMTLYVNGKKAGSTVMSSPLWNATGAMVIGAAKWNGGRADRFPGAIDDVQAWQRVLSAQDVRALATASVPRANYGLAEGASAKLTTPSSGNANEDNYVAAPIPSLQGYWRFDENAGTTVSDVSNNGDGWTNNLVTTNAQWAPGKTGNALHYTGLPEGGYSYSTAAAVNTSQSFTVSAWVKLGDLNGFYGVVGQSGTQAPGFQIRYSKDVQAWIFGLNKTDSTGAYAYTEWTYKANSVTAAGNWTLVTGVYNNDTKQIQLYVDGKLQGSRTFTGVPWDATGHVTVGAYEFGGAPQHFFNGDIDDVQIWQRALTASQVAGLAGLSYVDGVWNQAHVAGTATGGVSQTTDADAAKALFDGAAGSRVTWPRPANLRTDQSFTIEAWVKNDNLEGQTGTAVSISDSDHMPVALDYHPEWGKRWVFIMSHSPNLAGRWLLSDHTPVQGKWTHLAGTYDASSGTACFYVDGELQHSEVDTAGQAANIGGCSTGVVGWNNSGSIVAGAGYWNGVAHVNPWRGGIAGIRWHSGVRTADQVRDDRANDDPGSLFDIRH